MTASYKLILPPEIGTNNQVIALAPDQTANPEETVWARVIDLLADNDGDTRITLDNAGADNDKIKLICDGDDVVVLQKTHAAVKVTTSSESSATGALVVSGGLGVAENLNCDGFVGLGMVSDHVIGSSRLSVNHSSQFPVRVQSEHPTGHSFIRFSGLNNSGTNATGCHIGSTHSGGEYSISLRVQTQADETVHRSVFEGGENYVELPVASAFSAVGTIADGAMRVSGDASFALSAQVNDTLYLLDDGASEPKNQVGLKAPAAVSASYSLTLPPEVGTSAQCLLLDPDDGNATHGGALVWAAGPHEIVWGDSHVRILAESDSIEYMAKPGTKIHDFHCGSVNSMQVRKEEVAIQITGNSFNSTDGALIVAGGVGIAKNLNVGDNVGIGMDSDVAHQVAVTGSTNYPLLLKSTNSSGNSFVQFKGVIAGGSDTDTGIHVGQREELDKDGDSVPTFCVRVQKKSAPTTQLIGMSIFEDKVLIPIDNTAVRFTTPGDLTIGALQVVGDVSFRSSLQVNNSIILLDNQNSKQFISFNAPSVVTSYSLELPPSCPDPSTDTFQYRLALASASTSSNGVLEWKKNAIFQGDDFVLGRIQPNAVDAMDDLALRVDGSLRVTKRSLMGGVQVRGSAGNNSGVAGVTIGGSSESSGLMKNVSLRFIEPPDAFRAITDENGGTVNANGACTIIDFTKAFPTDASGEEFESVNGVVQSAYSFKDRIRHEFVHPFSSFDYTGLKTADMNFETITDENGDTTQNNWGMFSFQYRGNNAGSPAVDHFRIYPDGINPVTRNCDFFDAEGTIDMLIGSKHVSGTDTKFTTQLKVGDQLVDPGTGTQQVNEQLTYRIASIESDTSLTLAECARSGMQNEEVRYRRHTLPLIHRVTETSQRQDIKNYGTGRIRCRKETRNLEVFEEPPAEMGLVRPPTFRPILSGAHRVTAVKQFAFNDRLTIAPPEQMTSEERAIISIYGEVNGRQGQPPPTNPNIFFKVPAFSSGHLAIHVHYNDTHVLWHADWTSTGTTFTHSTPVVAVENAPPFALGSAFSLHLDGAPFQTTNTLQPRFEVPQSTWNDSTYGVLNRSYFKNIEGEIIIAQAQTTATGIGLSALAPNDLIKTDLGQIYTVATVVDDNTITIVETPTLAETSCLRQKLNYVNGGNWPNPSTVGLPESELTFKIEADCVVMHTFSNMNTNTYLE